MKALAVLLLVTALTPSAQAHGVTQREYGTLPDGRAVHEFTLDNGQGMQVSLLDFGGIVTRVLVPDRNGETDNVVLALPDLDAQLDRPNFGAIIGRYAGRISGGGVTIDGVFHPLDANAAGVTTHGGPGGANGFGSRLWHAEAVPMADRSAVRLTLDSPDGDNGFPGRVKVQVVFSLGPDNDLRLDYRATSSAPTVINLTHHAFFNLAGAGSGTVDRHWLRLAARSYTAQDARNLPDGTLAPVADTPMDLRQWVMLGARMRSADAPVAAVRGFDHNFVLDRDGGPALCAYDPDSGRMMVVHSDQPGLQLYTANGFDGTRAALRRDGSRFTLRQGDGFAVETQHFPDSPHHPGFPSTVLRPGDVFTSTTSFAFRTLPAGGTAMQERANWDGACTGS